MKIEFSKQALVSLTQAAKIKKIALANAEAIANAAQNEFNATLAQIIEADGHKLDEIKDSTYTFSEDGKSIEFARPGQANS